MPSPSTGNIIADERSIVKNAADVGLGYVPPASPCRFSPSPRRLRVKIIVVQQAAIPGTVGAMTATEFESVLDKKVWMVVPFDHPQVSWY
jgi:hypothetical protein